MKEIQAAHMGLGHGIKVEEKSIRG